MPCGMPLLTANPLLQPQTLGYQDPNRQEQVNQPVNNDGQRNDNVSNQPPPQLPDRPQHDGRRDEINRDGNISNEPQQPNATTTTAAPGTTGSAGATALHVVGRLEQAMGSVLSSQTLKAKGLEKEQ